MPVTMQTVAAEPRKFQKTCLWLLAKSSFGEKPAASTVHAVGLRQLSCPQTVLGPASSGPGPSPHGPAERGLTPTPGSSWLLSRAGAAHVGPAMLG